MPIKYHVDKELIPDDGSTEIIEKLSKSAGERLEISVFPDVHYKRGSIVSNGVITKDKNGIYPAMLGVNNCGFTFGKVTNESEPLDDEAIVQCFKELSKNLKDYSSDIIHQQKFVTDLFETYIERSFVKNKVLMDFLNVRNVEELTREFYRLCPLPMIKLAQKTLGTLGGGNHFFEVHKIKEIMNDFDQLKVGGHIFILHSDSIAVGDYIQLLYSNLHEIRQKSMRTKLYRLRLKVKQLKYFSINTGVIFKEPLNVFNLIFGKNDYRKLDVDTSLGHDLLKSFHFAEIFGDMNRDMIIKQLEAESKKLGIRLNCNTYGSHSHDSINIENYDYQSYVMQRNGVQYLGNDPVYILPGALGTDSFLMKNTFNQDAYFSANHGVGRMLDKHLAKEQFDDDSTKEILDAVGMKIFRVGSGALSEQNPMAFKDVHKVTDLMESRSLGEKLAVLQPLASIKG